MLTGSRAALGCESLTGRRCQSWVVTGDDAVFEARFYALDQVVAHEGIDHVTQGFCHESTGQVRIGLHLWCDDRDVADGEPTERIVNADAALFGEIERICHAGRTAPGWMVPGGLAFASRGVRCVSAARAR